MTNDVIINNIIDELCKKFNVASSELIPRLQAYGMAMSKFGAITGAAFFVTILIATVILCRYFFIDTEERVAAVIASSLIESIPLIVMLANIYDYIGWKYAPEIKSINYIVQLFKK